MLEFHGKNIEKKPCRLTKKNYIGCAMKEVSKKTKRAKKDDKTDFQSVRRLSGVLILAFGVFLLVALVSFIGSERNWLGPIFGKAFPEAVLYVLGKFSATLLAVTAVSWGVRLLLSGEFPRFSRVCVGFSSLTLLCPLLFAIASTFSAPLSLGKETLYGAGGRLGFFMVQSLVWPVFGKNNVLFPFLLVSAILLAIAVILFGLRLSHFSFLKTPFVLFSKFRGECRARREKRMPLPEKSLAEDRSLERAKAKARKAKEPDWKSDYTVYDGKAKPFRGPVGAFDGTIPVPNAKADEPSFSPALDAEDCSNVALHEIEEKERYLRDNEKRLGALEVRALRDEIAHLRQVQQMNDWENNRRTRPSIQGFVERSEVEPGEIGEQEPSLSENRDAVNSLAKDSDEALVPDETALRQKASPGECLASEEPETVELSDAPIAQYDDYAIPQVSDILSEPPEQKPDYTEEELEKIGHQLEEQLENFKVKGKVLGISTGPMITRFEVEPGPGVKVSKFASLHEDLALALKAKSIRILAPIPGKSLVGVEVPNRKLQTVYCRDIFESSAFEPKPDKLIIALGKDITGNPYTMDLCRAPHVLIAGQTGSGKSVCINTIMASLLFSKTPDELRMILVDPKVVELKLYENIPHLLAPVVTQPDQAVSALKWACVEMDRRYEELAKWKVRNLVGYNQKRNEWLESPDSPAEKMENMPYIVIVVDELADLMMVAGKEVEKYIARIAQKARAVGIHLVIATQRPSVNVITGLIKANLPARISFKVASQVDSRTVMDRAGAEKLLGRGDMLYRSGEDPEPSRVHGGFLTDEEVEKLADACANQNVHYERLETFDIDDPAEMGEEGEGGESFGGKIDKLALDVARYGIERGSLSTSEVQRHFSVGFSRAGKIVDQLERLNICGPKNGSKPRAMLVNDEQALYDRWPR